MKMLALNFKFAFETRFTPGDGDTMRIAAQVVFNNFGWFRPMDQNYKEAEKKISMLIESLPVPIQAD